MCFESAQFNGSSTEKQSLEHMQGINLHNVPVQDWAAKTDRFKKSITLDIPVNQRHQHNTQDRKPASGDVLLQRTGILMSGLVQKLNDYTVHKGEKHSLRLTATTKPKKNLPGKPQRSHASRAGWYTHWIYRLIFFSLSSVSVYLSSIYLHILTSVTHIMT